MNIRLEKVDQRSLPGILINHSVVAHAYVERRYRKVQSILADPWVPIASARCRVTLSCPRLSTRSTPSGPKAFSVAAAPAEPPEVLPFHPDLVPVALALLSSASALTPESASTDRLPTNRYYILTSTTFATHYHFPSTRSTALRGYLGYSHYDEYPTNVHGLLWHEN